MKMGKPCVSLREDDVQDDPRSSEFISFFDAYQTECPADLREYIFAEVRPVRSAQEGMMDELMTVVTRARELTVECQSRGAYLLGLGPAGPIEQDQGNPVHSAADGKWPVCISSELLDEPERERK